MLVNLFSELFLKVRLYHHKTPFSGAAPAGTCKQILYAYKTNIHGINLNIFILYF